MAININYTNKTIELTSAYTVLEMYLSLQDTFDELSQMDDDVPIKANTPTEFELINDWDFLAESSIGYLSGGSIKINKTNNLWANFYTIGSIEALAQVYWLQNGSLVATKTGYTNGHIDQLIKVVSGGSAIDSRKVTALIRGNASGTDQWGRLFDHFQVTAPATGGRNPVPLSTSDDLNDDGGGSSVVGITIVGGTVSKTLGSVTKDYDIVVDCGGNRLSDVYKYFKYKTRRDQTSAPGTGTGLVSTVAGRFYINANASYSEVKQSPFGTYAGGILFGARGVWLENMHGADAKAYQLISSDATVVTPPNLISVIFDKVEIGDKILIARTTGGVIDKAMYTVATATSGQTTLTINEAIDTDTPSAGYLRIGDDLYTYTSWAASTFSGLSPALSQTYSLNTDLWIPIICKVAGSTSESNTLQYVSDIPVKCRLRKLGVLPFEVDGTITSSGFTVTAIRTVDGVAV